MKHNLLLIGFTVFSISSCNIIRDERLVGDIYVVKNSDDNKYHMVVYEGSINSNVLKEYVMKVTGDDSILAAKCKNENNDLVFYKVTHSKGKKPIKSFVISSQEFDKLNVELLKKYDFEDTRE